MAFPLTFSMVLGLLNQLLIFCQLCLIKLLGLLTEFGMLVFFTNLSLMGFQVRYLAIFLLFSVIGGLRWFWMGNFQRIIQLMLKFLRGPLLLLHFSLYINDLPEDFICNIVIYADDTALYSKCHQASELWEHLELASELESDLLTL